MMNANETSGTRSRDVTSKHRYIAIDGVQIFYREAGPTDASVILLPQGYPSSPFQFRNFLPALADRWRLIVKGRPPPADRRGPVSPEVWSGASGST
jgi:pimeloyl-ACP methyl ester carboxylesterase